MPWNVIINDPCTNVELTDAVEVMQNFQYRLQDVLPLNNAGLETDNAYDLGSPVFRWRNLYLSGGIIMANATRVHAYRNANQVVGAGAFTTIIFNVEDYDLVGDYDNTTGVLTAITAGYYEVHASASIETTMPNDPNAQLAIYKNGALVASVRALELYATGTGVGGGPLIYPIPAGAPTDYILGPGFQVQDGFLDINSRIYLGVGDTLDVRLYSQNGNISATTGSFVDIIRRMVF